MELSNNYEIEKKSNEEILNKFESKVSNLKEITIPQLYSDIETKEGRLDLTKMI